MKKQIVLFIVALAFVLTITGAASAAANTTSTQYQIGQQVTQQALDDTGLKMSQSDKNLLITTASTAHLNGTTTEDSAQAVVDKTNTLSDGEKITYGNGNLLIINDPNGPLWFTFISQIDDKLMAKTYTVNQNGKITATSTVNIATTQTSANFQQAITALGTNGYNMAAIANLWAAEAPADLLAATFTTGTINQGTMTNYAMLKSYIQNYPNPTYDNARSYYVITHVGGMDDDAVLYSTPLFHYNYQLFSTNSGTDDETAFIEYKTDSNNARSGTLTLMKKNDLTSTFKAATGTTLVIGTLSEIKFDIWLLNRLENNPQSFFSVLASKNVNEANIRHMWFDPDLGYGTGIDESYIANLTDSNPSWTPVTNIIPETDYNSMYALGQKAYQAALATGQFTESDILEGNVALVTAPYYLYLNNKSLIGLIDGATQASGFNIHNILTLKGTMSNDAYTATLLFVKKSWKDGLPHTADNLVETGVKIIIDDNKIVSGPIVKAMDPILLNGPNSPLLNFDFTIPPVAGIQYAWALGAPYDYIRTISRVGCICSAREYDAAMNSMKLYPLNPNEHYILIALTQYSSKTGLPTESGRQIAARTTAYGVSPSQGTYYSVGRSTDATYDNILIKWNDVTQTGTAALIKFDQTAFNNAMNSAGYTSTRYAQESTMLWHAEKVWNEGPDESKVAAAFSVVREMPVNSSILAKLTAAEGDPVGYMLNYVAPVVSIDIGSGTYNADQTITLTAAPGTIIHYTLDGTTPTLSSTVYTTPISITKNTALKYIALDQNGYISSVYTQNYTIEKPNNPTNPTNPTNPGENYPETPTTVSAATETASTTPAESTSTPTATTTNPTATTTSTSSNVPIGAIVGVIILAIAAVLIYLARDTIAATIKGTEKPGK